MEAYEKAMNGFMLLSAAIAGFIYGITPGPGVLAMFNVGTGHGRRAAALFLAGHFLGDVVWSMLALVSIVGVTTINPIVFIFVGTVSAIYLIWIGWTALWYNGSTQLSGGGKASGTFFHGTTFGLTNPKAYPVATATLTALLSSNVSVLSWHALPLLLFMVSCGSLTAWIILLQIVGIKAIGGIYRRNHIFISRLSGILFIAFGVRALMHSWFDLSAMQLGDGGNRKSR